MWLTVTNTHVANSNKYPCGYTLGGHKSKCSIVWKCEQCKPKYVSPTMNTPVLYAYKCRAYSFNNYIHYNNKNRLNQ